MGACTSKSKRRLARSAGIDLSLNEDHRRFKRECKILLLGGRESGKSTIVRQMSIIHQQGGFTRDELLGYRRIIYRNVVESAQSVAIYMRKADVECEEPSNKLSMEKILNHNSRLCDGLGTHVYFPPDLAEAIGRFVTDTVAVKVIEDHMSSPSTLDSHIYFLNNISRIGAPGYVPTETDVLRAQSKRGGITETRFSMGQLSIHLIVIGNQRSERRKWLHCFESVTAIIFCAGLSDYDRAVIEDPDKSQTLMQEALCLFGSVVNSRWFTHTSIILFLTKIDLFKEKICKVPLANYFEEYTGGADVNKAAKYILWKFMQLNRARRSVYPHLTQAQDTTNIRLVFAAVKETILQNALRNSLRDPSIL